MARKPGAEPGRLEEEVSKAPEPAETLTGAEYQEIMAAHVAGKPLPEHLAPEERNHIIEPGHEIAPAEEVGKVRAKSAKYPNKSSKHILATWLW